MAAGPGGGRAADGCIGLRGHRRPAHLVNVERVKVPCPEWAPRLPVDDGEAGEVRVWDGLFNVSLHLSQVRLERGVLRHAAVDGLAILGEGIRTGGG